MHQAINLDNRGELDWSSLDPALVPYVERWRAFLTDSGAVVIASEQPVVHAKRGFAGTPDVVLEWAGRIVIPDIKVTAVVPPTVGAQTADVPGHARRTRAWALLHPPDRRQVQHASAAQPGRLGLGEWIP